MKFAFVAPEISTPFTEGRKRFVIDLIDELNQQHDLVLLTTTHINENSELPCKVYTTYCNKASHHLYYTLVKLHHMLKTEQPDLVCLFPYGTFRHLYGVAAKTFIWLANQVCKLHGIPCITLMYSIDEHTTISQLTRYAKNLAVSSNHAGTLQINTGIHCHDLVLSRDSREKKSILFLAGMWQQTTQRVEHVINTRGLGLLLKSGETLAHHDVKLIIAAPLFASLKCRQYLLAHPLNTWPSDTIFFREEVSIPDIFNECDLFAFPYEKNITQFAPTSVLEAMNAGKCVALTNQDFLQPLINDGKTAVTLIADSEENRDNQRQISKQILDVLENKEKRQRIEAAAHQLVAENWSITHSASQLQQYARELIDSTTVSC